MVSMKKTESSLYITAPGNPGDTIRLLRKKAGLTLKQLSERTGLAVSTISKLEMGRASLSYEKLSIVSAGLGASTSELMSFIARTQEFDTAPSVLGRRSVQRAGDGVVVQSKSYTQTFLAQELLNRQLEPFIAEIKVRSIEMFLAEFGDFLRHTGEEFTYVLEGEMELHSEFYAPARLVP